MMKGVWVAAIATIWMGCTDDPVADDDVVDIGGRWSLETVNDGFQTECVGSMTLLQDGNRVDGERDCGPGSFYVGGPVSGTIDGDALVLHFYFETGDLCSTMTGSVHGDGITGHGVTAGFTDEYDDYAFSAWR